MVFTVLGTWWELHFEKMETVRLIYILTVNKTGAISNLAYRS
jgi:hypothetical protein